MSLNPIEKLQTIERIASTASWQERAMTPTHFARFCAEILRVIDIDELDQTCPRCGSIDTWWAPGADGHELVCNTCRLGT
ncbi:hypothetical protein PBI_MRMAGOO_139 [Mycobacterium phage MrMagoo]|uniref:Uncharacterized protein n=1 Tax=Mycobacterium phage MrMagoo TaxID=1927020 RepID=A0A1L6BYQ9_9CAUD|nr:hypothetical protein J4U04_gp141 [Mycobacterium phage MrMagoo]APQ42221.1 hypothetical protein PBI_MRMAGOO_139 [Mycobacterium phage MrMagoo]ARM70292.1 hypothetical protein SEA_GARDENSALSA_137 [Mycobacterium phage GardenSalsa]